MRMINEQRNTIWISDDELLTAGRTVGLLYQRWTVVVVRANVGIVVTVEVRALDYRPAADITSGRTTDCHTLV